MHGAPVSSGGITAHGLRLSRGKLTLQVCKTPLGKGWAALAVPKSVLELVATGNELGESRQGLVEPECSKDVWFNPDQLGNGQNLHFAAGRNGRWLTAFCCQPCYGGSWCPPPSQAMEWRGIGPAIGGHSPALGEQGLRGAKLFEQTQPSFIACCRICSPVREATST